MTERRQMAAPTIRLATKTDLPHIQAIYNEAVATSVATFDDRPRDDGDQRAWFDAHGPEYPVTVAVAPDGVVLGYASLSRYNPKLAYRPTVENSVYLAPAARGQGVGTLLLADLVRRAGEIGYHSIIALISGGNDASVALHLRQGFQPVGTIREAGFKFGRWVDVSLLQLRLDDAPAPRL
jgi:L-amino acid N-acyltransferase